MEGDVTITYGITGDTAVAGVNFAGGYSTVVMPSGASEATVSIPIYNPATANPTLTFAFSIVNVSAGTLWAPRTSRISILDAEHPAPAPASDPPLISQYTVNTVPVVTGLDQPLRLHQDPLDPNKMFVAEKPGLIALADTSTGAVSTILDLRNRVNEHGDRGILDMALHPDFAHNPYIYVFATMDPPDSQGLSGNAGPDGAGNRYSQLLRFTADASTNFTTILPGSEKVLLGAAGRSLNDISGGGWLDYTDPSYANNTASDRSIGATGAAPSVVVNGIKQDYLKDDSSSHVGGALAFGPDGELYVSVGDGTSFDLADPRSVDVQSLDSLSGKILRIDPATGLGLTSNPFYAEGMSLSSDAAKVFQYGLRNPFSLTFDQEGRLFITETGWNSWEEINTGGPGANFGWPYFEGGQAGKSMPTAGYSGFGSAAGFYAAVANGSLKINAPFAAFSHLTPDPGFQIQAITGGHAVYTGNVYPTGMQNQFFFSDFAEGHVFTVNANNSAQVNYLYTDSSGYAPVDFMRGGDGYVYAADIATGQVQRLVMTALPTTTPVIASIGAGAHALLLQVSQDPWQGSAQYVVSVDGTQVDGTQTAGAMHGSGKEDSLTIFGDWGPGPHTLTVNFLNDAYGGTPGTDRNLYVDSLSFDGTAVAGQTATLLSGGPQNLQFSGGAATGAAVNLGSGGDTLVLLISQDAYKGSAQYTVSVDGAQLGGTQNATALHRSGAEDTVTLHGNWGSGAHKVTVTFLNDTYDGTPTTDRNLYVDGITFDGATVSPGQASLLSAGAQDFAFGSGAQPGGFLGSGAHVLVLGIAQDAWQGSAQYLVTVDGVQFGGTQTASALQGSGRSDQLALHGDWGAGPHTVTVTFLNDAHGGTPTTDRNLYVNGITYDGAAVPGGTAALLSGGPAGFVFSGGGASNGIGAGSHALVLQVTQDAWQGNAQYTVSVDAIQQDGTQTAAALHGFGQEDSLTIRGNWGAGAHVVTVNFLNDAYAGTPGTDRNLYVDSITYDGQAEAGGAAALLSAGPHDFAFA